MTEKELLEATEITLRDGQRVFRVCAIPIFAMCLAHMVALVIVASSTVPRVSKNAIKAYGICVAAAKTPVERAKCIVPKPEKTGTVSAKMLDAGPYPWIGVIVLFLFGGVFYLMQSNEDWRRAREVMQIGSSYVNKNQQVDILGHTIGAEQLKGAGERLEKLEASLAAYIAKQVTTTETVEVTETTTETQDDEEKT